MSISVTLGTLYTWSNSKSKWVQASSQETGKIGYLGTSKYGICQQVTISGLSTATSCDVHFIANAVSPSFTGAVRLYVNQVVPDTSFEQFSYIAYGYSSTITFVSAYGDVSTQHYTENIGNGTYYFYILPYSSSWTSNRYLSGVSVTNVTIGGTSGYNYYWKIKYYLKDTNHIICETTGSAQSDNTYYDILFNSISAASHTTKKGNYTAGSHCLLYPISNPTRFRCTNTSTSSEDPFVCYVQSKMNAFAWAKNPVIGGTFSEAITASRWNTMNDFQDYLSNAYGARITTTDVASGNTVTSLIMNYCLSALRAINNSMSAGQTIPNNVSRYDEATAELFTTIATIMNEFISSANPS